VTPYINQFGRSLEAVVEKRLQTCIPLRHRLQTFQNHPRAKEADAGGASDPHRVSRKVKSALALVEQTSKTLAGLKF